MPRPHIGGGSGSGSGVVVRWRTTNNVFLDDKAFVLCNLKVRRRKQQLVVAHQVGLCHQKDYASWDTFHRAVKPYMHFAHLFGVMPLVNTLSPNPYRLEFRVKSIAMFFTALFLLFGGFKAVNVTASILASGLNGKNIVGIVFFWSNLITCMNFIRLAKHWPQLIRQWTRVDLVFMLPPYGSGKWLLQRRLNRVAWFFAICAFLDHCLYYVSGFYNYRMHALQCRENNTHPSFIDYVANDDFKDFFAYVPYHICFIFYAFFLNWTFTFVWNFLDLFIMFVGLSLGVRFEQFAEYIETLSGNYVPDAVWYELRQQHIQLCELMERVDEQLSTLVLMSSLINMYFICNHLLNIFTKLRWPINYIYFWYSLTFLILRSASVFLCADGIHGASTKPLRTLYMVPSDCWSEEVQRFTAQIANECIGLTGKRFFVVTRRALFGLIATIVTYEFMLLQFDANSEKMGLPDLCG